MRSPRMAGLVATLIAAATTAVVPSYALSRTAPFASSPRLKAPQSTSQATQATPLRPGDGVTLPRVLSEVKPSYTLDAMQARVQGTVVVEAVVLPNGSVGDVRVVKSLDKLHGLDNEAIRAAKRWTFRPGTLNGKAVPVLVTIELTFTLRDDDPKVPLGWPAALSMAATEPTATEWAEEIAEDNNFTVRLTYPRGWTVTRLTGGDVWLAADAPDSSRGLTVMRSRPSTIPAANRFSAAMMKDITDHVRNSVTGNETKIRATGQVLAANHLWFWYEAWVPASDPAFLGYAPKEMAETYSGALVWSFTLADRGRELTVHCSVLRPTVPAEPGASEQQMQAAWDCRSAIEKTWIARR